MAALRADAAGATLGTVVLVPGFTGSKEDFIAVLEPLAARGWDVLAYDQRGQHESPGPADESAYSLPSLAADLLEVLGAEGGAVHVVGHSFGGLVAREAALAAGGAPLASLTLLCSGPGAIPASHHENLGSLRAALPDVPLETIWSVKEPADRAAGWDPSPGVAEFCHRRFVSNSPWGIRAKATILCDTPDRTGELAALGAGGFPVAVVYGPGDDAWTPAEQDAVARAVGTAAVVVPDCGHSPAAEQPEATAEALDTLLRGFAARSLG